MSKSTKKILVIAAVAVLGVLVWRAAQAKTPDMTWGDAFLGQIPYMAPFELGNHTVVSPESTITIGPPTITKASDFKSMASDAELDALMDAAHG